MRCDILTNWSVNKSGKCRRVFCIFRLTKGCAIVKHGQFLKSKLMRLAEQKAEVMRKIADEVS